MTSGPPPAIRRGVIDIGTNSVKLLVAEVEGDAVTPVLERTRQTRLGRGFYPARRLQPGPVTETATAVAAFAVLAREHGAARLRAIATSAAREADNAADLIDAVRTAAGLEVEVIAGSTEAEWGFEGVMSDERLAASTVLLLDVGGGSTEFTLGRRHAVVYQHSGQLGVVRLLETLDAAEPPTAADLARGRNLVEDVLAAEAGLALRAHLAGAGPVELVATGGTATVLGAMALRLERFDREALDGLVLGHREITERLEQLWSLPLERRRQVPGLPPERADVILTGALIYDTVMATFGFGTLRVTTRSLRYGALQDRATEARG